MKAMGLDQSYTSTGIWIHSDTDTHVPRLIKTEQDKEDGMSIFKRARTISNGIMALCDLYLPDIIVIEGLAYGAMGDATRNLAGLQFMIIDSLVSIGYSYEDIHIISPTTLKKFAVRGGAKKEEMFDALPEDIKLIVSGFLKTKGRYDVTDAYYLAKMGMEILGNQKNTTGHSS